MTLGQNDRIRDSKTNRRRETNPLIPPSLTETDEEDSRISETVTRHGGHKEVRDGGGSWTSR
jgi:hypothetical protein